MALERNPAVAEAAVAAGYDFCCHGYKWINYQDVPIELEREHMHKAVEIIQRLTGKHPEGWFHGRIGMNTRKLVVEEGGFLYDSDDFSDDLPFWQHVDGKPLLIIPYTLDNNDLKFVVNQGFNSGDHFFTYLKDGFDALYEEGEVSPKMMSIGLHERLVSRPGRIKSLARFIDYAQSHERVWICRRSDIARHWIKEFPTDK